MKIETVMRRLDGPWWGSRWVTDNSLRGRRRPKAVQKAEHELMSCEQRARGEKRERSEGQSVKDQ